MGGHSHCRPIACVRAPYEPNQPQSYSRIGHKLYAAFDAKDRLLGRFKTRKDAYAAISNESGAATRSAPFAKEGQRAVLCIVAGEIKHRGLCDLPIDKIAALAPRIVVAGHKAPGTPDDDLAELITGSKQYITDFDEAAEASASREEIVDKMLAVHGDRGNVFTLWNAATAVFSARHQESGT